VKGLLLLSCVGAGIYALLLVTHDVLPGDKGEDTFAGQTQPNNQVAERPGSWNSYIRRRSLSQNPQLATSQQPAELPPQQSDGPSQNSERKPGAENQLAASEDKTTTSESAGLKSEPVDWAKVVLTAQTHSQASVSSPTIRFYRPGTELQVVGREGAWVQLSDPATQERGWIFEKYLASIDGPSAPKVATESIPEPLAAKPALPKSKKRSRHAVQVPYGGVVANSDPWSGRWARRVDRRRGFGLFMFRPLPRFAARGL
jgi:hypothetical protein